MKLGKYTVLEKTSKIRSKVLFISSPIFSADEESDTFDYFAYIVAKLSQELEERFSNIDLVVRVPLNGPDAAKSQMKFIRSAIENKAEYLCIVVNPIDRDRFYHSLPKWIEAYGNNKILFIDQGYTFDRYRSFHGENYPRPPFVQANWIKGGKIAGVSMAKYLFGINRKAPEIVIMTGNVGSEQRTAGFKSGLEKYENGQITLSPSYHECFGNYSKKEARDCFESYLKSCISDRKRIDGIFACNDEMALGIRDCLDKYLIDYCSSIAIDPNQKKDLPIIIGFDGIKDMTLLIDNDQNFLYDTVCVFPQKQVEKLADIIENLVINGQKLSEAEKFIELDCASYRDKTILV